jgi:hypothetical protein
MLTVRKNQMVNLSLMSQLWLEGLARRSDRIRVPDIGAISALPPQCA